jgi:hypothetical protein
MNHTTEGHRSFGRQVLILPAHPEDPYKLSRLTASGVQQIKNWIDTARKHKKTPIEALFDGLYHSMRLYIARHDARAEHGKFLANKNLTLLRMEESGRVRGKSWTNQLLQFRQQVLLAIHLMQPNILADLFEPGLAHVLVPVGARVDSADNQKVEWARVANISLPQPEGGSERSSHMVHRTCKHQCGFKAPCACGVADELGDVWGELRESLFAALLNRALVHIGGHVSNFWVRNEVGAFCHGVSHLPPC